MTQIKFNRQARTKQKSQKHIFILTHKPTKKNFRVDIIFIGMKLN